MPGKFEAPRNRSGAQRPNDQPQRFPVECGKM